MCDVGNGVACARVQVQVPCLHLRAINWIYAACVRSCGARSSFAWAFLLFALPKRGLHHDLTLTIFSTSPACMYVYY